MTTDYATLVDVKADLDIDSSDTADDAKLGRMITAVSRQIDKYCGFPKRRFYQDTGKTRYFTAEDATFIYITDCYNITQVQADMDGDGVFDVTWALNTDYLPAPYNAPADGRPWIRLEIPSPALTLMPAARHGLKITGDWGWPSVPPEVNDACILQVSRRYGRKESPMGVAPIPADATGVGVRLLSKLDPDVELMLKDFRRPKGVG